jgi:non-ribosomal peptide synthetase component F
MDSKSAGRNACAYENVLIYADDELLYAALPQKLGSSYPNLIAAEVPRSATHLNALLRGYTRSRQRPADPSRCVPLQRRFELIAQTTPCAIAVKFNGRHLTYGELDEQADELALHLQADGLVAGSFCVMGLDPSLAQVRAILAALKAGAACLQFDPALTDGARAAVLAMFEPAILFTRDCGFAATPVGRMRAIRCAEEPAVLPHGWPDEMPVDGATPAHAFATVSTSGSLCISVRSHRALGACVDTADGNFPSLAADPDPAVLWRPLSIGAPLTIGARP